MKTIIDVGCAHLQSFKSIEHICDSDGLHPEFALGLDPRCEPTTYRYGPTLVTMLDMAAWTSTGSADWDDWGIGSCIRKGGQHRVKTIDLAALVHVLKPAVLKLDCEGAEWELLKHLREQGADTEVGVVWVEWHPGHSERHKQSLIRSLRCDVVEWHL
jgi:hypothetical protein